MTCNPGASMVDKLQRHTPEMETKLDLIAEDGTNVCIIAWSGVNAYKAMLAAGAFQDSQRLWRRIKKDRKFDIDVEQTRATFAASGKEVGSTGAVLLVTGTLTEGTPASTFHAAATKGDIPGLIGQVFLAGTPDPKTGAVLSGSGAVYLFSNVEALEAYTSSDEWQAAQAETPWEEVSAEKYVVATQATALGEHNA
jgi:hypothetical protein